jgi:hypothetical protein
MKNNALDTHEGGQGLSHWEAAACNSSCLHLVQVYALAGVGQGPSPSVAIGHALSSKIGSRAFSC